VRRLPARVLGIALLTAASVHATAPTPDAGDEGRVWFLRCLGQEAGDGSAELPFQSAENAVLHAAAGDTIMVLPVDAASAPACVIELAPGQRLVGADATPRPRVTRVTAAAGTEVIGLDVVGSGREAITISEGTVVLRDVVVRDAAGGVLVDGSDVRVVMERVTVDGVVSDAVLIESRGSGTTEVSLRACTVTRSDDGVVVAAFADAAVTLELVGSRFEDIAARPCWLTVHDEATVEARIEHAQMTDVGFGVLGFVRDGAVLDLEVDSLVATGIEVTGVNVVLDTTSTPTARVTAGISGGRITKSGGSGHGVRLTAAGSGVMTASVTGIAVNGGVEFDRGISAEAREGDGRLDVTLTDNRVVVGPAALAGIMVRARDGATACAEVRDNTVDGGSVGIAVGHRDGGHLELVTARDGEAEAAAVEAMLRAANPGSPSVAVAADEPIRLVTACRGGSEGNGG
jgi:hypothetical protein